MKLTLTPEGELFYKSAEELLAHALKKRLHKPLFYYNQKAGNALFPSISGLLKAGDERIELPPKVLETPIIPFDQSPI